MTLPPPCAPAPQPSRRFPLARLLPGLLVLAALLLATPATTALPGAQDPPWLGIWRAPEGGEVLLLEAGRAGWLRKGEPRFYRMTVQEGGAALEHWARVTELGLTLEGERLRVAVAGDEALYERIDEVPPELLVEPYPLPEPTPIDPDVVSQLRDDLLARRAEDQRVRTQGEQGPAMAEVDLDNTAFLLEVTGELGWIDAERFGSEAADAAFLLVQHSPDLRLMRTALPFVERDARAGQLELQLVALLHDRLQLRLGYLQRYGTQLGITPDGEPVLMPMEDPERVDERRAEMGMGPLAGYLALFRERADGPIRTLEAALGSGR